MRGGSVRLPGEEDDGDPYNKHAQSAMLLAHLESALTTEEWLVVRARHTIAKRGMLAMRKDADTKMVFQWFIARMDRHWFNLEYARDVVRRWAGYNREHDDKWWATELETTSRTLRRWRNGWYGREGFMHPIETAYGYAISKVVDPWFEAGVTQE
jgi:hypothetical protein